MWCLITSIHKQTVGSLYREISKGYSWDSLRYSHNSLHLQYCNWVFMSVLGSKTGQNVVYRHHRPHSTVINHDARPTIIDTLLTFIFKMGQGAFRLLSFPYKVANTSFMTVCNLSPLRLPRIQHQKSRKLGWRSSQNGVGSVSLFVLIIPAANTSTKDNDVPKSIFCN